MSESTNQIDRATIKKLLADDEDQLYIKLGLQELHPEPYKEERDLLSELGRIGFSGQATFNHADITDPQGVLKRVANTHQMALGLHKLHPELYKEERDLLSELDKIGFSDRATFNHADITDPQGVLKRVANTHQMAYMQQALKLGRYVYAGIEIQMYDLACGPGNISSTERQALTTALGISDVDVVAAIASLLITQLFIPSALAHIIAAIIVKRFFNKAHEKLCDVWKKNLPVANPITPG